MNKLKGVPIEQLKEVMKKLRHPTEGCPWDCEQTFSTVAPYTVEEAYEVEDAISCNDLDSLKEELGDLLLQVIFHARIAEEEGHFDFDGITEAITLKMIERHPHVFGEESQRSKGFQNRAWEEQKTKEREKKMNGKNRILSGVALSLPALMRSGKLIKRTRRAGLDPCTSDQVLKQIQLTINEAPFEKTGERETVQKEAWFGDLLFLLSHLALHQGVDTEKILRETNRNFEKCFNKIELKQEEGSMKKPLLNHGEWIRLFSRFKRQQ